MDLETRSVQKNLTSWKPDKSLGKNILPTPGKHTYSVCVCVCVCVCVLVAQLCLTLSDPMDYSLPGSSVHGILQAWILEWVAIPFSKGIFPTQRSNPGILHCRQFLYQGATTEDLIGIIIDIKSVAEK